MSIRILLESNDKRNRRTGEGKGPTIHKINLFKSKPLVRTLLLPIEVPSI